MLATGTAGVAQAELSTLFTTPQERQIINANRYKSDDPKPQPVDNEASKMPVQQLLQEEVTREYSISGITVSTEGAHTVWINSRVYEDGSQLDDNSRIKVLVGNEIKVRITAPDGKHYFATSGEALKVTYLAPVEN
jgi:hypothetical protein